MNIFLLGYDADRIIYVTIFTVRRVSVYQAIRSAFSLQTIDVSSFFDQKLLLQLATYDILEAIPIIKMALLKIPNDDLVSDRLTKQTERNRNLESLLWNFARRNYSALNSGLVQPIQNRIGLLRYKITETYKSLMFDVRHRFHGDISHGNQCDIHCFFEPWVRSTKPHVNNL